MGKSVLGSGWNLALLNTGLTFDWLPQDCGI